MNEKYWHSVRLEKDNCTGCTNCLKHCPTQAIRIQQGKAKILKERCIDCGECIRVCPHHAKKAVTDRFDELKKYKYNIALVAPAFYGQFSKAENCSIIQTALKEIGFDDVYDVAKGAQEISKKTKEFLEGGELTKPAISSACPAVCRLIAVRFPNLIPNIIPLRSPMELSAEAARRDAVKLTGLSESEIGIFFISPCAAKATAIKDDRIVKISNVDGVISIKDTYLKLAQNIGVVDNIEEVSKVGSRGVLWANSGGEAKASGASRCVAVDGIHNVIKLLDDIEDDKLMDIEYVEALACPGGCVGGPLTAENSFVARARIDRMCKEMPCESGGIDSDIERMWDVAPVYRPVMKLDEDINVAMQMAIQIDDFEETLPGLDCGACGAPSCRAFAEDVVRGHANETDCIFTMRELVSKLTNKDEE